MTLRNILLELLVVALILAGLEGVYRAYKIHRYGIVDYPDVLSVGYFRPDPRYGTVANENFRSETMVPAKIRSEPSLRRFYASRYTTNSLGYRTPEFTVEKQPGTFRVVALGESTTMNMELDDPNTWPAKLQTRLQADPVFLKRHGASRVEVINASCGGWRSREGLIRLREEIARLHPDVEEDQDRRKSVHPFGRPAVERRRLPGETAAGTAQERALGACF